MIDQQWIHPFEQLTQYMDSLDLAEQKAVAKFMQTLRENHEENLFLKGFLGFHFVKLTEKSIIASIPVHAGISNGRNMVSGGVLAALADATMGGLAANIVNENQSVVTANLSINYIAPGRGERLDASAKIIHIGRNTLIIDCMITNELKKLIAKVEATFFIVPQGY